MRILSNETDANGLTVTTLERNHDEDLVAVVGDGMYQIGPYIVSGHDLNCAQRVFWDTAAQEWKKAKP